MTDQQELEILRSMKRRLELMLEHNVTKFKNQYPLQEGEYDTGYISASLIKGLLQRVEQKFENVAAPGSKSAGGEDK